MSSDRPPESRSPNSPKADRPTPRKPIALGWVKYTYPADEPLSTRFVVSQKVEELML
ncbi:hypothetical protein [[Phormidium] sp. ETS-05]|uniref:hypothetical protein n=1 Tax=[Phormidium] sp. ETS-05 TaxID=222819 RepID=UPI0018EED5FF|nr:hypothetical protein [[Phormidium] sp. ETS-05]